MMIQIGGNLRRLRAQKGLTQEQLAEIFHVSAQAVSRWENDQAYPDMMILPGLALFYETTVDDILGMARYRKEERLQYVLNEVYSLARAGEIDAAIERIQENLRIYPNNSALLIALSETMARKPGDSIFLPEAILAAERVLENHDISMKARSTVMVNLLFLYMRTGSAEKAKRLIRELPHIWESREMVMAEVHEGEEYREELKKAVRKALSFLCMKIDGCGERVIGKTPEYVQLGVEFENGMSDSEMMEKIRGFLVEE